MNLEINNALLKLKVFETAETFFERQYPPEGEIIIGRNEQCDLVLTSRRTSKKHCRIYFVDQSWHLEDLGSQNGTIVNGAKVKEQILNDGDTIQIGDYRIEIEWKPVTASAPPAEADDDRTVVIGAASDDRTIVRPLPSSPGTSGSSAKERIITFVQSHKIASGVIGAILLFFLIVLIMPSSGKKETDKPARPQSAEANKAGTVHDLETQERIDTYLQSGREQLEAGNYSQALVRFQAVLEIDPENQSARSSLAEARQKLTAAEDQRRQALEEKKKQQERVKALTAQARQAMAAEDFYKARENIAEALYLAPDNPDVVKLSADIEAATTARQLTREQEKKQRAEDMALLKQHFERGQAHYDKGDYREALIEWEALLAMNIESPETAHTRAAIVHLRDLMEEDIRKDYEKASRLYHANDLTRALVALHQVFQVAPDYKDTRKMLTEVLGQVESQARQLYQEGLVYEGLGQMGKAAEKWRRVLKVMPLEDNEYYQRALKKLQ